MASIDNQPGVSNYFTPGDTTQFRAMPTVGLEYRYPFINVQSWGTQTIEPIAQVIVRPNETEHRQAAERRRAKPDLRRHQSVPASTSSPAGTASKAAAAPTSACNTPTQFNRGGFVNALFGQSYQLFGTNSFAVGDTTNTGLDSGLDTNRSDYVARAAVSAGPRLVVHHPLPLRPGYVSKCGASRPKPAPASTAGRSRCCTASTTPSRSSASWSAAKASSAAARSSSRRTGWRTPPVRYDLDAARVRRHLVRHRLHRRLPHCRPELHEELHLQRRRDPGRPDHAADDARARSAARRSARLSAAVRRGYSSSAEPRPLRGIPRSAAQDCAATERNA